MQRSCRAEAELTPTPAATRLIPYLEWKWRPRACVSASSMTVWTVTSLWQSSPSHVRMTAYCDTPYVTYTVGRQFCSGFSLPSQVFMFSRGLGLWRKARLVSLCLEIITTENSQVRSRHACLYVKINKSGNRLIQQNLIINRNSNRVLIPSVLKSVLSPKNDKST